MDVHLEPLARGLLEFMVKRSGLSRAAVLERLLYAAASERPASDVMPNLPLVPEAVNKCWGIIGRTAKGGAA